MDRKFANRPFAETVSSIKRELRRRRKAIARAMYSAKSPKKKEKIQPPPAAKVDDSVLFMREMAGVTPLGQDNVVPTRRPASEPPRLDDEAEAMAELADLVDGRTGFDISDSDEFIEGIAEGLDRRLLRKLRKGTFSNQAHLDLHGMTRLEAREEVQRFVTRSRRQRRRCVLLVHGRGLNSPDQIPVLKTSLQTWLTRSSLSRSVLAFCTARPQDGGAGALYVLLRR